MTADLDLDELRRLARELEGHEHELAVAKGHLEHAENDVKQWTRAVAVRAEVARVSRELLRDAILAFGTAVQPCPLAHGAA